MDTRAYSLTLGNQFNCKDTLECPGFVDNIAHKKTHKKSFYLTLTKKDTRFILRNVNSSGTCNILHEGKPKTVKVYPRQY